MNNNDNICNSQECYNNLFNNTKKRNCPLCSYDISYIEDLKNKIKKDFLENQKAKQNYGRIKFAEYSITICFCSLVIGYVAYILIIN